MPTARTIEWTLTPAEVESIFFALRTRVDRCVERAQNPDATPSRVAFNTEEADRCLRLSQDLLRMAKEAGRAKK